ncbi:MAG: YdcF family protein [Gemmatimonadaceae bacterium]
MTLGLRGLLIRLFVGGPLVAWVLSLLAVTLWGQRDGAIKADAIVVLGAAQYAGRPSPVLKARLDHAVDLYRKGLAKWFVVTGGTGPGDTTSEAAVSRRYASRNGVPDAAILAETVGRSTDASLTGVASLMQEHKLRTAILVSDPFHSLRLQILARHYGIDGVTSPTRTSPISANRGESITYILGESVKVPVTLLYTFISGSSY